MVDQIQMIKAHCPDCDQRRCGSCGGIVGDEVPEECSYKEFCGREEVMELRRTQRSVIAKANLILQLLSTPKVA